MSAPPVIRIECLSKTYASGHSALKQVDLSIQRGEIFALLGPNGAGKTTLISTICGIVNPSSGRVLVAGYDIVRDWRKARSEIGLVPQELVTDVFETVWTTLTFSRGLFGKPPAPEFLEQLLKDLALWDKKDAKLIELSGGMKRRVMIAKALSHEPNILFLDEPTAGVDVELRRDLWAMVRRLRERGVTIILTTHYIEEAEEMADRIGVIRQGQLILVEEKATLMQRLGRKELLIELKHPLTELPFALQSFALTLTDQGHSLQFTYDGASDRSGIAELLAALAQQHIEFKDLKSSQSSLEDIFVSLVHS